MEKLTLFSRLSQMLGDIHDYLNQPRPTGDRKDYPELSNMIASRFNQDYDLNEEYDEDDEIMYRNIVNSYSDKSYDYIIKIINQINKIITDGKGVTEDRLIQMGCGFSPEEQTSEEFLLSLRDLFIERLKKDGVEIPA